MQHYFKYACQASFGNVGPDEEFIPFSGVASTANIDRTGDVIDLSFWSEDTLNRYLENPVLLYNHNRSEVVGMVTRAWVDEDKLKVEGQVSRRWEKSWQVEQGLIKSLSVAVQFDDADVSPSGGLHIKSGQWIETSLVPIGANSEAMFSLCKSFDKAVGRSQIIKTFKQMTFIEKLAEGLKKSLGIEVSATEEDVLKALGEFSMEETVTTEVEKALAEKLPTLVKKSIQDAPTFDFTEIQEKQEAMSDQLAQLTAKLEELAEASDKIEELQKSFQGISLKSKTAPGDDGTDFKTIADFRRGVESYKIGKQKSFK